MKIGMLFPDYGSQFVGMGKELYDQSRLMQEYFEEAFNCLNINFVKLCFASSDAELARIENAYVSIFLISVATAALLKQEHVIPAVVAGYGIGEISATCVAGGLSFPDGLYLLHKYAQFYQEALPAINAAMVRVDDLPVTQVNALCTQHPVTIAVYETDTRCVVSGETSAVDELKKSVSQHDARVYNLPIEMGLHSALMDPVVNHLEQYLEKIDFNAIEIPLIASIDGKAVTKKDLIKQKVIRQLHAPLMWNKVIRACSDWDIILEIGPGTTLGEIVRTLYPDKQFFSINKLSDIEAITKVTTP